ncbi:stemmadenine O-acetyltransferase-like [Salvia miltiorrhiza]|uniref:stemmadenine O-acetyltransferase-like n=1 Tax=Salvia miltiorrhiza TaxID=226208 RepID=UPI0025AD5E57|nr:stemmadenine O-acetyltransferase-like [Salvia miltiorrhiza]
MIKPSSPTPIHLRNLKLSLLDQIAPPIYVPLIFFYNHHQLTLQNLTHHQISLLLKQSLSKTLTVFYPLAGRIHENSSIDCNDSGAEFIEARVHTRALSEIIQDPSMEELKKLQPVEILGQDQKVVLKVKICFFGCGGISVAICMSHKIADGTSLVAFVNAWAASSRGEPQNFQPSFDLASVFPPKDPSELEFTQKIGMTEEKIATKRFVFDKEELEKLRNSESEVKNPTRVEAVSSYIWRRFMDAVKAKDGVKTTSFIASHAVNLRPRRSPPFPQHMFGNCWRPAIAVTSEAEGSDESELVGKLRAAITRIDGDFIREVENGEYLNLLRRSVDEFVKGGVELCSFSSWCRFPVHEVDFGWGEPVWACPTLPFKNSVILMSTPCGEGIEAWVNVGEEDDVGMF